jgi:DnaJ-class molecular chaperone
VRIPLDYYRILGLPIQATADQLQQAHRDRTLQLPRREYSEVAIEARKALIDEAYGVLSEAEQRQKYDRQFLVNTYDPEPAPPASPEAGEAALRSLAGEAPPPKPRPPPLRLRGTSLPEPC